MKILPLWAVASTVHAKFDIPDFEFPEQVDVTELDIESGDYIRQYGKIIHDNDPRVASYVVENEAGYDAFKMGDVEVINGKKQGRIYPIIEFDREEKDEYHLIIKSMDASGNVLESTKISAIITDVNDNVPYFVNTPLEVDLVEGSQEGDVLGTITADDSDDPRYTHLRYSFVEDSRKGIEVNIRKRDGTESSEYFKNLADLPVKIAPRTGIVKLSAKGKKYADAETYESLVIYNLQVKDQVEDGIAPYSAESHLTIQIKDINDNAPVFDTNGKFTYKIKEDTQVGQPISKVNFDGTTDADVTEENSMIGYKIEGAGAGFFGFNDQGQFILKKSLDYETKNEHVLNLIAYNPNGEPGDPQTARDLKIIVGDVNEAPVFTKFIGQKPPPMENDPGVIGSSAGKVVFNDDGDQLSYSLVDEAGFFEIDQNGNVKVIAQIDREWACMNYNGASDGAKGHPVTITATDQCSAQQQNDDPSCSSKSTEQEVWIPVGNEDDSKAMIFGLNVAPETTSVCKNSNVKHRISVVDCDGDAVTVTHDQKDLVEIARDAEGYYLRIIDEDKVDVSAPLTIRITVESSFMGQSYTPEDHIVTLDLCNCDDNGENKSCGLLGPGSAGIPWWLIVLIAFLVLALLSTIIFVTVRRRRKDDEYDPLMVQNTGDIVKGVGPDSNGSEFPGQYDGTMTLPYQKGAKPDWAGSKPDGELADIINSFKETADQEDTFPNGLLTFEFEGRNSMISDLSSLHSYGSEQSLNLDNLPEQVKKQFR